MNTKPKWLERNKRVMEWEREPGGISVVAAYGYAFEPDPDHNHAEHMHFYPNAKEARADLKLLRPCSCLRCTSRGKLA